MKHDDRHGKPTTYSTVDDIKMSKGHLPGSGMGACCLDAGGFRPALLMIWPADGIVSVATGPGTEATAATTPGAFCWHNNSRQPSYKMCLSDV
jgi:hypothetical protein